MCAVRVRNTLSPGVLFLTLPCTLLPPRPGTVRLKLYKGGAYVMGRKSPYSLYDKVIASFEDDKGLYNQVLGGRGRRHGSLSCDAQVGVRPAIILHAWSSHCRARLIPHCASHAFESTWEGSPPCPCLLFSLRAPLTHLP